jgi:hypothetical protein
VRAEAWLLLLLTAIWQRDTQLFYALRPFTHSFTLKNIKCYVKSSTSDDKGE